MNPTFPYWFAILLACSTLAFYLLSAVWNRSKIEPLSAQTAEADFNLGLPESGDRESLFAIALVAAGTSLSTVFVFFLTAGALYGWWLLLSPVMFLLGNVVMFTVYRRIKDRGYFAEQSGDPVGAAGLVPYLAVRLTGSRGVGYSVLLLSVVNLLAVLVLELIVSVDVFSYLVDKAAGTTVSGAVQFTMFVTSIALLLGYVYVGGFRAVVASDVWQMKLMRLAVFLTVIGLAWFALGRSHGVGTTPSLSGPPWGVMLWGFILNVTLANVFVPMSQESSWQRFRAFALSNAINEKKALAKSLYSAGGLWLGLIGTSFLLLYVLPADQARALTSMSGVLEQLKGIDDALFPLFLFPLMVVAGLSAMFSTADTCVSAILFLLEFPLTGRGTRTPITAHARQERLRPSYYIAMASLFVGAVAVYGFVRLWFDPTILQLVFSVFSNLVVIAPCILSAVLVPPASTREMPFRRNSVIISLSLGFVCYWCASLSAMIRGQDYLWLSQLSILVGLVGATLPVLPLWFKRTTS